MARPSQDAIDTFVSITGASAAVAVRKLEEHGGDLNEAINAYFTVGDRTNVHTGSLPAQIDFMDSDDLIEIDSTLPSHPLQSAAQNLNPFPIMNSSSGQRYFDGGASEFSNCLPHISHPREVREIPIEFKDGNSKHGASSHGPTIEEVTGTPPLHDGSEVHGTVIIDDEDDDLPDAPIDLGTNTYGNVSLLTHRGSNPVIDIPDDGNDIEEEMLQAAIEASKRDAELSSSQNDDPNIVKEERLSRNSQIGKQSSGPSDIELEDVERVPTTNGRQGFVIDHSGTSAKSMLQEGNTSAREEAEDVDEEPLVRHHSRSSGTIETANVVPNPPSNPHGNDLGNHQPNGDAFQFNEWGGISSEEHDEAVMLEAAMFGGIPEGTYNFAYPQPQIIHSDGNSNSYPRIPRPPSPSLTAQRLLKEQQDDEYLAALQADREKELKAILEAEHCRLEEAAARQTALEEEKHREEESHRQLIAEEEFERILAAKQVSLPNEPSSDDENAVTLLIRMPDGSRCGRRFLKSDKLQFLFDYIDVGRTVKPGTYRLVRPYPRRVFTDEESTLSLGELGLNSKQEALFLELI